MPSHTEVIASLDSLASELSLLKHPFYREWAAGTLSRQRLRNYAAQYYPHVAAFSRYLSALHSRCEDLQTRQMLLENLIEEERGAENHPELWLRFAEALGETRDEVLRARPLPATEALVETFTHLSRDMPLQAGLAALYVYESQIPAVAAVKIEGLKRFYGIADEEALRFFTVHRELDPYHARAIAAVIARHDAGPEDSGVALEAGRVALKAVWGMLDSI